MLSDKLTITKGELQHRLLVAYRVGWSHCEKTNADRVYQTNAEIIALIEEELQEIEKHRFDE